ncbi:MAG: hypothetical protein ACXIUM_10155 [Wenzhouxiangella sp.]
MTILVVLLGLALSHLFFPLARLRNFDLLLKPARWARRRFPEPSWAVAVIVVLTAVGAGLALTAAAMALLGPWAWFLLALAVFVYTLGPRDLDRDVQALLIGGNEPRYLKARRIMRLRRDAGAPEAAAAVFRAADARWFGILFWFIVLGIPGALLYRLTRLSLHEPALQPAQAGYLRRLRQVLDWPVLVLMLCSAALVGDFDRMRQAWHRHRHESSRWRMEAEVLDEMAAAIVTPEDSFEQGVRSGHQLARRMLLVWLVVLSILLILGWLS